MKTRGVFGHRFASPSSWQSLLVLAVLAPVLLDGCVSVGVSSATGGAEGAETGSLQVVVVEKSDDKQPTKSRIVTRLVRLESGGEVPVAESTDSAWTQTDLPAGRYRLRVSHWIDETGQPRKFAKTDQESFQLRAGEAVEARVVLKDFPTGPVITIAAIAGAAIITVLVVTALGTGGSGGLNLTLGSVAPPGSLTSGSSAPSSRISCGGSTCPPER